MKKFILFFGFLFFSIWGTLAYTADDHDKHEHSEKEEAQGGHNDEHANSEGEKHEEHADHKDGDGHAHGAGERDEEEGEGEGGSTVGPEKGITEKAEAGFKLSVEAFKTMGILAKDYAGSTIHIPAKAIVSIKNEKTVFRIRGGWFKRVKVEILKKDSDSVLISSKSFRSGDQIVTEGSGFLRIAEIYAEEGASHSHAH